MTRVPRSGGDRRTVPAPPRKKPDASNGREGRPLDVIEKWEATILGRHRPRRGGPAGASGARPRRGDRT